MPEFLDLKKPVEAYKDLPEFRAALDMAVYVSRFLAEEFRPDFDSFSVRLCTADGMHALSLQNAINNNIDPQTAFSMAENDRIGATPVSYYYDEGILAIHNTSPALEYASDKSVLAFQLIANTLGHTIKPRREGLNIEQASKVARLVPKDLQKITSTFPIQTTSFTSFGRILGGKNGNQKTFVELARPQDKIADTIFGDVFSYYMDFLRFKHYYVGNEGLDDDELLKMYTSSENFRESIDLGNFTCLDIIDGALKLGGFDNLLRLINKTLDPNLHGKFKISFTEGEVFKNIFTSAMYYEVCEGLGERLMKKYAHPSDRQRIQGLLETKTKQYLDSGIDTIYFASMLSILDMLDDSQAQLDDNESKIRSDGIGLRGSVSSQPVKLMHTDPLFNIAIDITKYFEKVKEFKVYPMIRAHIQRLNSAKTA